MNRITIIALAVSALALSISADARQTAKKPIPISAVPAQRVLICEPIDIDSNANGKKNLWAAALLQALARFKFESLSPAIAIAQDGDSARPADAQGGTAQTTPPYFLCQKYFIDYRTKSVRYTCEVLQRPQTLVLFSAHCTAPFDGLGRGIDSCLLAAAVRIAPKAIKPVHIVFFGEPALSPDFRTNKKLGELILDSRHRDVSAEYDIGHSYQRLLNKGLPPTFGLRSCGDAVLGALPRRGGASADAICAKTAKSSASVVQFFEQLGDGLMEAKCWDNAEAVYRHALRSDGHNAGILIKISTCQLIAHHEREAAETYLAIYETDHAKNLDFLAKAGRLFGRCRLPDKAAQAFEKYLGRGRASDPEITLEYARMLYTERNYQKVIGLLKGMATSSGAPKEGIGFLSESYCATGQYALAAPLLDSWMAIEQGNLHIIELSAAANNKLGNFGRAAELHERYVSLSGPGGNADNAYRAGSLYERSNQTAKAIARYEENVKRYPEDIRNYERLGALYVSTAQWEKARAVLETALEFPQPSPGLKKLLAQAFSALNQKNHAAQMYQKYCNAVPDDPSASLELGKILFEQKRYDRASEPLSRATKGFPKDIGCWRMLGLALVAQNKYAEGLKALERAHSLDRSHLSTLEPLAHCYRSLGQDDNLASTLKEWASLEPKRSDIRLELGSLYLAKGKNGEAIAAIGEAAALMPLEARPHTLLARCYEHLGDDSMQLYHLKEANRYGTEDEETYDELGRYYLSHGRNCEAEACMQKAVALNSANHRAVFDLGSLLLERNAADTAFLILGKAVSADPANALYQAQLGRAAARTGNKIAAAQALEKALQQSRDDARILSIAGLAYKNLGERDRAKRFLGDALLLNPNLTACGIALGDLSVEERQFKQAVASYLTAWERGGYREELALKLGMALFLSEKNSEAKDFFETVVLKNSGQDEARFWLVAVLCNLGEQKKAAQISKGFARGGLLWPQLARGIIGEKEGDTEAAALAYSVVLHISPDNPLAHEGLARIFACRAMVDSALCHYACALRVDSLNPVLMMEMGKAYEKIDKGDSALACYAFVNQHFPDHPAVQIEMARILSGRGQHGAALVVLKKGIAHHPSNAHLYTLLGQQYEFSEDYQSAIKAYQMAINGNPKQELDALLQIGKVYQGKLVDGKKAKKYYERYLRAGGRDGQALAALNGNE